MTGGTGADILTGDANANVLTGGAGGDTLNGGAGNDTFTYTIGDGADIVNGGLLETDTLNIIGLAAAETLDVIFNGTALTTFEGGTIADVEAVTANLNGGVDILTYAGTTAAIVVNLTNLAASTASGFTSIANIENVVGGSNDDTFTGTTGATANTFTGGLGNDTYNVDGGETIVEALAGGTDLVLSSAAAFTLAANVDNLTLTGAGNINGTGNGDANVITGNGGNNVLSGLGSADTINAGAGNDTLIGGALDDILNGGAGNDTFTYTIGDGGDIVDGGLLETDTLNIIGLAAAETLDVIFNGTALTTFEGGTIADVEAVTANLNGGVDILTYAGTTAAIVVNLTNLAASTASGFTSIANIENVVGGSNDDTFTGTTGATANTFTGGLGNDTYNVDGGETIVEALAGGTDLVLSSAAAFTLAANVENLTLTGVANINGTGNGGANVIIGNTGNNILTGAGGIDSMTGGLGDDTFDFNASADSAVGIGMNDVIMDFEGAGIALVGDLIDLSTIDANVGVAGNQNFAFIGTAAFTAAGQVRYVQSAGDTFIQTNTDGNVGNIEMEIQIEGTHTFIAGDFIL